MTSYDALMANKVKDNYCGRFILMSSEYIPTLGNKKKMYIYKPSCDFLEAGQYIHFKNFT